MWTIYWATQGIVNDIFVFLARFKYWSFHSPMGVTWAQQSQPWRETYLADSVDRITPMPGVSSLMYKAKIIPFQSMCEALVQAWPSTKILSLHKLCSTDLRSPTRDSAGQGFLTDLTLTGSMNGPHVLPVVWWCFIPSAPKHIMGISSVSKMNPKGIKMEVLLQAWTCSNSLWWRTRPWLPGMGL